MHLKMDEKVAGDAQTLYDTSGNENDGTTEIGANRTGMDCTISGKYGSGCEFDGTDDYVDCGTDSSLDITGPMTISSWVKRDNVTVSDWEGISNKWHYTVDERGYGLFVDPTDEWSFHLSSNGSDNLYVVSDADIENEVWHHLTGVYDGTTMYLYVDGILQSDTDTISGIATNNDSGER